MKLIYFISYFYVDKNNDIGFGNVIAELKNPITTKNFIDISNDIKDKKNLEGVTILNFIKLEGGEG